ncbi:hypothetical protein RQP46_001201 [Phenoliferia psychrophenolica]
MRIPSVLLAALATSASAAVHVQDAAWSAGELGVAPVQEYHSSDLTPPEINLWTRPVRDANAATEPPLYTFIGTRGGPEIKHPAPMILDDDGELMWMGTEHGAVLNFERNQYLGQDILSFYVAAKEQWFGGHWRILNSSYDVIGTIEAKYTSISLDPHELHILNDIATVVYWEPVIMDLSNVGGPVDGWVFDCRVQSINITSGELIYQWNSAQHIPASDSFNSLDQEPGHNGTSPATDFCVADLRTVFRAELDSQGNYIVSARGPSTVLYIDGKTGEVLWRLGGRRSSFAMGEGTDFWFQHHARIITTGPDTAQVSLFDNGANQFEMKTSPSRGMVVGINTTSMEATLLRSVVTPFAKSSMAEGSVQLLDNGHLMVGWGVQPFYTEFDENDQVFHSAEYGTNLSYMHSYRIYKYPFVGQPTTLPSFAMDPNTTRVGYVSWNGATQVSTWRVLEADAISNFTWNLPQASSTRRSGFETTLLLSAKTDYVAVAAYDEEGICLGASEIFSSEDGSSTGVAAECPVDDVIQPPHRLLELPVEGSYRMLFGGFSVVIVSCLASVNIHGMSMAYGATDDEASKKTLQRAIDIADMYGGGANEKLLGSVLSQGDNRSKVFLVTKFGFTWKDGVPGYGLDDSPWALEIETNGLMAAAAELGVVILAYRFLTGRFTSAADFKKDAKDNRVHFPRMQEDVFEHNFLIVKSLQAFAQKKGCTPAQLALAWLMAQGPATVIPIPGTKSIGYLEENFAAADVVLSPADLKELRAIVDGHQSKGDRYMAGMQELLE